MFVACILYIHEWMVCFHWSKNKSIYNTYFYVHTHKHVHIHAYVYRLKLLGWNQLAKALRTNCVYLFPIPWSVTLAGSLKLAMVRVFTPWKSAKATKQELCFCFSRELFDKHLLVPIVYHKYKKPLKNTPEVGNIRFHKEGRMVSQGQAGDLNIVSCKYITYSTLNILESKQKKN